MIWNDVVPNVFGVSAAELQRLYTDERSKLSDMFDGLFGKEMMFSIRGKSSYKEVGEFGYDF